MSKRIAATYYEVADHYLLSCGRYKTKLTGEDMPPWYLHSLFYGYRGGYMRCKDISQLYYKPNLFSNHMFKDDFLFIQYEGVKQAAQESYDKFCPIPYHEYVWGWNIARMLVMAEKYSGLDISGILEQIKAKEDWFRLTYPTDYAHEVGDESIIGRINRMRD